MNTPRQNLIEARALIDTPEKFIERMLCKNIQPSKIIDENLSIDAMMIMDKVMHGYGWPMHHKGLMHRFDKAIKAAQ